MRISNDPLSYHVFVLRCWQEHSGHPELNAWRFNLQDPGTGQHRGFATLEALLAFLTNQFGAQDVKCDMNGEQQVTSA